MHKLDKFLRKYADGVNPSQTTLSRYYTFGLFTLRISDHVSYKGDKCPISIILTDKDKFVLHIHKGNKLSVLSYEEVKTVIKSLSIYSKIFTTGDYDYQSKLERANTALKAENSSLKNQNKILQKEINELDKRIEVAKNKVKAITEQFSKELLDPAVFKRSLVSVIDNDKRLSAYTQKLYSSLNINQRRELLVRSKFNGEELSNNTGFLRLSKNQIACSYLKAVAGHDPNEILNV